MKSYQRMMLKTVAVLVTLGLLVNQGVVTFNSQESRPTSDQLSIEPVTKASVAESVNKNITLDDVFLSVKTSRHNQYTRLPIILKTWFQLAKNQIWFFTDTENRHHIQQTNGHMINTNCPSTHALEHLCCKTSWEYDRFLESGKKWWCHFDDDNYVNVPRLVSVLQNYDAMKDWYLGRPSVSEPVTIYKLPTQSNFVSKLSSIKAKFWFATGGAGYCITRSLGLKMLPVAGGGKFGSICEKIRLPEDVTMGYVVEHLLKSKLTFVPEFHSHFEQMKLISPEALKDQISVSYMKKKEPGNETQWNVVNVPGFDNKSDPTRLLSLHCFLFPDFKFCPR